MSFERFHQDRFAQEFSQNGHVVFERCLPEDFIERAREELSRAIALEAKYHGGTEYQDYGMVLLCALYGGVFWEMFELPQIVEPFNALLGEGCILYSQTSTSMPPDSGNYATRIHVDDARIIPGYCSKVAALIALDDFSEENGATWFLEGSHQMPSPPSEQEFYAKAKRFTCPAGTIRFWNPRTWHAGGRNQTAFWRHALTAVMVRPYMKQRIDVPRALSQLDLSEVSPQVMQKLGFHAQVPASYDEYYAPPEKRKWRQKAE